MTKDYIEGQNNGLIMGLAMSARLSVSEGEAEGWYWWRELDMKTCQSVTPSEQKCEFLTAETFNSVLYTNQSCENVMLFVDFLTQFGFSDAVRTIWLNGSTSATKDKIHRVGYTLKYPGSDFLFIVSNCATTLTGESTTSATNTTFRFYVSNGESFTLTRTFTGSLGFSMIAQGNTLFIRESSAGVASPFKLSINTPNGVTCGFSYITNPITSLLEYISSYLYKLYPDKMKDVITLRPMYYLQNVYGEPATGILNKTLSYVQLNSNDKRITPELMDLHTYNIYIGVGSGFSFVKNTFITIEGEAYYVLDVGGNSSYGIVLSVLKC